MGAIAARIESLATDAAAIAAIMATTAPSGRDSMRPWLHSRMCKRATLPRHAQMSAESSSREDLNSSAYGSCAGSFPITVIILTVKSRRE